MRPLALLPVLCLLLTACNQSSPDAQLRRQVVGTWRPTSLTSARTNTVDELRADGSFSSKWAGGGRNRELLGAWQVQNGFLVVTATNPLGSIIVQRSRIVQISKDEMVCQLDANTNLTIVMTRQ